jgi:hypothetical protein
MKKKSYKNDDDEINENNFNQIHQTRLRQIQLQKESQEQLRLIRKTQQEQARLIVKERQEQARVIVKERQEQALVTYKQLQEQVRITNKQSQARLHKESSQQERQQNSRTQTQTHNKSTETQTHNKSSEVQTHKSTETQTHNKANETQIHNKANEVQTHNKLVQLESNEILNKLVALDDTNNIVYILKDHFDFTDKNYCIPFEPYKKYIKNYDCFILYIYIKYMYLEDPFKENCEDNEEDINYKTHFYISINSKNKELKQTKCGLYVSTDITFENDISEKLVVIDECYSNIKIKIQKERESDNLSLRILKNSFILMEKI